jgi:transposase InsO family protein
MSLWAVDTIERIRDGMRRYVMSFIDPNTRIAFAVALPSKSSANTAKALDALLQGLYPEEQESNPTLKRSLAFLSDNGSEFKKYFDALLKHHQLTHYWTYPRCPKMNAHNERFNRTLQEQFVEYHEELLFSDINAFNRKLAEWIVQYNTIIPHHSLNLVSPLQSNCQPPSVPKVLDQYMNLCVLVFYLII